MIQTESWAWYPGTTWPGFDPAGQNNIGSAQDGLAIGPESYAAILWNDASGDGVMDDADAGDGTGTGETVTIHGVTHVLAEVGAYEGSILTVNGQPVTVQLGVWLFTDGTYLVRLSDAQIPPGVHHGAVTGLNLGQWNGIEYSGSYVDTRDDAFVCFAAGTLIHAKNGLVPVEDLQPGDMVLTADHGFRPLRWTGRRRLPGRGRAAPVRIARGAMGNARDLFVSQLHRMVVSDWRAELFGGASEMLVPARALVDGATITLAPCPAITYVHVLFDRHEIVFAEGIASESFHPGAVGLSRLEDAVREEVLDLFPELRRDPLGYGPAARPCATAAEARVLARSAGINAR